MRWLVLAAMLALTVPARAADTPIPVVIKDHRFAPSEIAVEAGKPHVLDITNQDAQAEEFEMRQLAIEKVIPPGGHGTVRLRPLGPGSYDFIGEFHADTATGHIVAK